MDNNIIPLITIGIPTWNRVKFLKECLDSIIPQILEVSRSNIIVDVFISDNGSSDETHEVVESYRQNYNFINYHRNDHNLGFKANLLNVLHKSKGKYIWFFGDDDKMIAGALKKVADIIQKDPEIPLIFGLNKEKDANGNYPSRTSYGRVMDFKNFLYFSGGIGLISCLIINKEKSIYLLDKISYNRINNIWPHMSLVFLIVYHYNTCFRHNGYIATGATRLNKNTVYSGIGRLKVLIEEKYFLIEELSPYIDYKNLTLLKQKVFRLQIFLRVYVFSAFLDSYIETIKEGFYFLRRIDEKSLKWKFFVLFLPLFIPPVIRKAVTIFYCKIKRDQKVIDYIKHVRNYSKKNNKKYIRMADKGGF